MPFGEILTRAGKLVWKFKILWLFGLLAGCTSGSGARLNFAVNPLSIGGANGMLPGLLQNLSREFGRLVDTDLTQFITLVALLASGLGIIAWLIGVFGRTGLAVGAWQGAAGSQSLDPGWLIQTALPPFWRVAVISLLVGMPGFAVALIFLVMWGYGIATMFGQSTPVVGAVFLCLGLPLLCVMVPLFWALGILSELATVAVVGEGLGVGAGLKRAWGMFKNNLGPVLLVGLVPLAIHVAEGLISGVIVAPLAVGVLATGLVPWSLALLLSLGLAMLALSLVFDAVVNAFVGTLWVLVFRHLAAPPTAFPSPYPPAVTIPPFYPDAPPPDPSSL